MKHYEPAYAPDDYDENEHKCRLCGRIMSKVLFIGHYKNCEMEYCKK